MNIPLWVKDLIQGRPIEINLSQIQRAFVDKPIQVETFTELVDKNVSNRPKSLMWYLAPAVQYSLFKESGAIFFLSS